MITVTNHAFDPAAALRAFQTRASGAGAIVSFTGLVRDHSAIGDVTALHLQAYDPLTTNGITAAAAEAQARWPLSAVTIIHRTGDMSPADPIVFVATASAHRRAAFDAADFLMDYLKTQAIFWKKEITPNGAQWIEPRAQDYADQKRWSQTGA